MASDNNDNQPTSTFEETFADVQVDNHDTRSRFVDPESLEEESRRLHLNQEDVNDDFNQGCMYEDTATQNLPFHCLLNDEILWYQMNFNFLISFRKRPTNDVNIQGNTR
jgi:hypothetical protein